ncbi:hypothetical protein RB594_002387 [Gaeumannomyces avenae]
MQLNVAYILLLLLPILCWAKPTPVEAKKDFSIPSNYMTESLGKYSEKFLWRVRKCLIYQKVQSPQNQAKAAAPQDRIAWCYPPSDKINGFNKVQKAKSDIY